MKIQGTLIQDTFAEAFRMWACRLIITAADSHWAQTAAKVVTGYAASVIGCDTEAGIERDLTPQETPDGRVGVSVMFFAFNADKLAKAVPNRVGQCLMTCPTVAVYDGMSDVKPTEDSARLDLGKKLRFFGDGNQKSKLLDGRRYWRVPIMEGEFLLEESFGAVKAIGGGNFLVCGENQKDTLLAAQEAVTAIQINGADRFAGVITPFPGGIVRSGSKVGSKYKGMFASTNDEYCPTLAGRPKSKLTKPATCVYEIVINGVDKTAIQNAMQIGIRAACGKNTVSISAGNYGGNLGKFHFKLHEVMNSPTIGIDLRAITSEEDLMKLALAHLDKSLKKQVAEITSAGISLTYKNPSAKNKSAHPIDGAFLQPDQLLALPIKQLEKLPITTHAGIRPLADLFEISKSTDTGVQVYELPVLDLVAAGMQSGELTIHGDVGHLAGASMSAGKLTILGSALDKLGGPHPGAKSGADRGMTGGTIYVSKNTGDLAGMRMRRGIIVVGGAAGRAPGYRMIAGTIMIAKGPIDTPGLEMQRGTIMCLHLNFKPKENDKHPDNQPKIKNDGHLLFESTIDPDAAVVLPLLLNQARKIGLKISPQLDHMSWSLYSGDHNETGKGEVWTINQKSYKKTRSR